MTYSDYFNQGNDPSWDDAAVMELMAQTPTEKVTVYGVINSLGWDYFRALECINRLKDARKVGLNNKLLTGDEPERIGLKVHHRLNPHRQGEVIAELPNDKVRVKWDCDSVACYHWTNLVVDCSTGVRKKLLSDSERLEIEIQKLKDSARHQALRRANEVESDYHAQKTKRWRKTLKSFEAEELLKRSAQIRSLELKLERLCQGWRSGDEFIDDGNRRGRLINRIESKQVDKAWLAEFNGLKCVVSEDFISPVPMEASGQLLLIVPEVEYVPEPPDPDDFQTYQEYQRAIAIWEQKHPELASMLTTKNKAISPTISPAVENPQTTTVKGLEPVESARDAITNNLPNVESSLTFKSDSPNKAISPAVSPAVENSQTTTVKGLESAKSARDAIANSLPNVESSLTFKSDSPNDDYHSPPPTPAPLPYTTPKTAAAAKLETPLEQIPPVESWGKGTLFEIDQSSKKSNRLRCYWIEIVGELKDGLELKFYSSFNPTIETYTFKQIHQKILKHSDQLVLYRFNERVSKPEVKPEVKPKIKPEVKERKCAPKGKGSGYIKMREANKKRNAEKGKPPSFYYVWYYSFTDQWGQEYKRSCYLKLSQVEYVQKMIDNKAPYTEILKWLKK